MHSLRRLLPRLREICAGPFRFFVAANKALSLDFEEELAALPNGAFAPDLAIVSFNNAPAKIKPETGAGIITAGTPCLPEALE